MKGKSEMSKKKNETAKAQEPEKQEMPTGEAATDEKKETSETAECSESDRKLEEAKAQAAEYLALAQRVQADFENYRRRNENVRADAYADGKKDAAAAMLPVLDNLERAVDAAAESTDEALKSGVQMVLKQMTDAYKNMDVTPIDRCGEKFDPNLENAVLQGTAEDGEPGTVCQVLQKGYMIGSRVLRHAMVKVVPE